MLPVIPNRMFLSLRRLVDCTSSLLTEVRIDQERDTHESQERRIALLLSIKQPSPYRNTKWSPVGTESVSDRVFA